MNEKIKRTRKIPIKKLFRELDIDAENNFAESLNEVISEQDELDFDDDGNPKELFFD
jgi:hypothetical protein